MTRKELIEKVAWLKSYREQTAREHDAFTKAMREANVSIASIGARLKKSRADEDVEYAASQANLFRTMSESFRAKAELTELLVQGADYTDLECN